MVIVIKQMDKYNEYLNDMQSPDREGSIRKGEEPRPQKCSRVLCPGVCRSQIRSSREPGS